MASKQLMPNPGLVLFIEDIAPYGKDGFDCDAAEILGTENRPCSALFVPYAVIPDEKELFGFAPYKVDYGNLRKTNKARLEPAVDFEMAMQYMNGLIWNFSVAQRMDVFYDKMMYQISFMLHRLKTCNVFMDEGVEDFLEDVISYCRAYYDNVPCETGDFKGIAQSIYGQKGVEDEK